MIPRSIRASTALVATLSLVLPDLALAPAAWAQQEGDRARFCLGDGPIERRQPPCPQGEPRRGTVHDFVNGQWVPRPRGQEDEAEAEAEEALPDESQAEAESEGGDQAAAEAEARAQAEAEAAAQAQAEAEAEAQAEAEEEAQAEAEAEAQAQAEREARREAREQARAEAEAQAQAEAAQAEAEAEAQARAQAEAEAEAQAQAEAEARAQAEADAAAQAQAEADAAAQAQADEEARAQAEAEAEAQAEAEAEARAQAEAEAQAQAEAEAAQAEAEAEAQAEAEAEARAQAEAEAQAQAEADAAREAIRAERQRLRAEAEGEAEEDQSARQEARARARAEADAEAAAALEEAARAEADDEAEREARRQERREERRLEAAAAAQAGAEADANAESDNENVNTNTNENNVTVNVQTIGEGDVRRATEDFDTTVAGERRRDRARARAEEEDVAEAEAEDDDDDDGLSDIEKLLLLGLGAAAVGTFLNNGEEVVSNSGDRVVTRGEQGDLEVYRDDDAILYQPGAEVRTETYPDGSTRTILDREDGTQVVTIRDSTGRVLRRAKVLPDGTQIELFDDLEEEAEPVNVVTLLEQAPPPVVVDAQDLDVDEMRAMLNEEPEYDPGRDFSLGQIRDISAVRNLMPAIDLDVNFPTGSAAIPGDQLSDLVEMGILIEDALIENPSEVFLVEGHTDAVGSDASNLALSDRRAESVALALAENFEIPPENLVVQGYGEEFLKVPTEGPESGNRRATIRRITPLLGEQVASAQ